MCMTLFQRCSIPLLLRVQPPSSAGNVSQVMPSSSSSSSWSSSPSEPPRSAQRGDVSLLWGCSSSSSSISMCCWFLSTFPWAAAAPHPFFLGKIKWIGLVGREDEQTLVMKKVPGWCQGWSSEPRGDGGSSSGCSWGLGWQEGLWPPCAPPGTSPQHPWSLWGTFWLFALGRLEQPGEGSSCSRSEGTECWEHSKLFSQSLPLPARCWWLPERRKGNLRALAVLGIVLYPSQRTIQGNRATGNWAEQDAVDGKLGADDGSSPSVPWANWSSFHPKRGSGSITPSPGSRCCENKPSTSPLVHFSFLI